MLEEMTVGKKWEETLNLGRIMFVKDASCHSLYSMSFVFEKMTLSRWNCAELQMFALDQVVQDVISLSPAFQFF